MENTSIGFGALESGHDERDLVAKSFATTDTPPIEDEKHYDFHLNQRAIGICTAISVCTVLRQMYGIEFSPQFLYVMGKRTIDKNMNEGSSIRTMLQTAYSIGCLPLADNPLDNTRKSYQDYTNITFTQAQIQKASQYKLTYSVARLDPVGFATDLHNSKYGLLTRMSVGDNFYSPSWRKADLELLRKPVPVTSGHAILVKKYSGLGTDQRRKLHNTWGDKNTPTTDSGLVWCDDGDIDYIYSTQKDYVTEAWMVSDYKPVEFKHVFRKSISYGNSGTEVEALQKVLVRLGYLTMPVGVKYGFYGDVTAAAVLKFQIEKGVASMAELLRLRGKQIGAKTCKVLNENQ